MKKSGLVIAVAVLAFLGQAPSAFGNVGGVIDDTNVCGSGGTLYRNLTGLSMNFELGLSYQTIYIGQANCTFSAAWTDASGHVQSLNVPLSEITSASSSLPAGGVVSWTSSGDPATHINVEWQLERAPAQSVAAILPTSEPGELPCASTGTLYANLRGASVNLDLAVGNPGNGGELTVSWTDAGGHAQTINLVIAGSQGASTTLPAGGLITWTTGTCQTSGVWASWQVERVVTTKLW
jgi:hypothetical protein